MVLNSLSFCLSVKLLISPSNLNEILAGQSNLGCRFFPFITLNISCHSLLACRVSAEKSAVNLMKVPSLLPYNVHSSREWNPIISQVLPTFKGRGLYRTCTQGGKSLRGHVEILPPSHPVGSGISVTWRPIHLTSRSGFRNTLEYLKDERMVMKAHCRLQKARRMGVSITVSHPSGSPLFPPSML